MHRGCLHSIPRGELGKISSSSLEWRTSVRTRTLGKEKKRKVEGLQLSTMPCRRKSKHLTQLVLSSVGPWSIALESARLPRCLTLPRQHMIPSRSLLGHYIWA
ncbi:hypothetical protein NC651_020356 [Populus alba x Populus x berolinensis]|nr:hypothetical protein NC651_020356 [Populus alba x Populus x berolinensis]